MSLFGFFWRVGLTSVLGLNGDDSLPLRAEALRGRGLNFELVGHVLAEVWHSQAGLGAVTAHLEGAHVSWVATSIT